MTKNETEESSYVPGWQTTSIVVVILLMLALTIMYAIMNPNTADFFHYKFVSGKDTTLIEKSASDTAQYNIGKFYTIEVLPVNYLNNSLSGSLYNSGQRTGNIVIGKILQPYKIYGIIIEKDSGYYGEFANKILFKEKTP